MRWPKFLPAESRYNNLEREANAICYAFKKWGNIVGTTHTDVITDCLPLVNIFHSTKPSVRLSRWIYYLSQFDYKVMYRAGKLNHLDFLSRISYSQNEREEDLVPTQEPFLDAIISMNNNDADDQIGNIQDKDSQAKRQTRRYESLQLTATQHVPTQAQACCSEARGHRQMLDNIIPSQNYAENES